jgi:hypothetical protein
MSRQGLLKLERGARPGKVQPCYRRAANRVRQRGATPRRGYSASPAPVAAEGDEPLPTLARVRRLITTDRGGTLPNRALSREERRAGQLLIYPDDVERPWSRGDCQDGARPCPWVSCRYHLYLDVDRGSGSLKLNFPDREPWELEETCSLDVADRGGETLERVGELIHVTRERTRQIEVAALGRARRSAEREGLQ